MSDNTKTTKLTWWESFLEEHKKDAEFDKIFKAIDAAENELTDASFNKLVKLVYKLDREKYENEIIIFDRKIKILETRLDRQLSDNFGSIIRHEREKKKLSLVGLSKLTGISASYINRIELGERKSPSFAIIETLAEGLDMPVSDLLNIGKSSKASEETLSISKVILSTDLVYEDEGKVIGKKEKEKLVEIIEFIIDAKWEKDKHVESIKLMQLVDEFKRI